MHALIVLFNGSDEKISGQFIFFTQQWHEKLRHPKRGACLCTPRRKHVTYELTPEAARELVKLIIELSFKNWNISVWGKRVTQKVYCLRFMTILGRVNRTLYDISIFRTGKVVYSSIRNFRVPGHFIYLCGCALNNDVYSLLHKGNCPTLKLWVHVCAKGYV